MVKKKNLPMTKRVSWREAQFATIMGILASSGLLILQYWILRSTSSLGFLVFHNSVVYIRWYLFLTMVNVLLFGVSTALFIYQWRRYGRPILGQLGSGGSGAILGLFASICPICGTTILAGAGMIGSLSALPLKGLEIKGVAIGLLILSIAWASWQVVRSQSLASFCPVPRPHNFSSTERIVLAVSLLLFGMLSMKGWQLTRTDPFFSRDPSLQSMLYQCHSAVRDL